MKVYLVGAGSGKCDLITVRGLNILKQADVIIYDYLTDKTLFNKFDIKAELISCEDLGKKPYAGETKMLEAQNHINRLMADYARQGKKVVRLKGGDVSVFSRISEELNYLNKHGIGFEVVPGITAGAVASAYAGIPLTDRNFSSDVMFVSGHEKNFADDKAVNWQSAALCSTVIVYMGVKTIRKIADILIKFGKPKNTPVYCVSNIAVLEHTDILSDLENIADDSINIKPPAIFIIGEIVSFNKKFGWFRKSKKILYTGLSDERFFLDEMFFHVPMIDIKPLDDYKKFDLLLNDIKKYRWIIFTSRYGVKYFFERFYSLGFDSRDLNGIKIAVIGNSTKNKLKEFGINSDLIPDDESSDGLLESFSKIDVKDRDIFIPQSDLSDKGIPSGLVKMEARITSAVAYRNVMPDNLPDINFDFFDGIFFTSPSTVRNFVKRYGNPPKRLSIKCIGKVTYEEAKKWNILNYNG